MLLMVNGVELPKIKSLVSDEYTITDSERNDYGNMIHEFITVKRKLNVDFAALANNERQIIYNQIRKNKGLSLAVTYFDPNIGKTETMDCYVGNRTISLLKLKNNVPEYWGDFKLSFIEN